MGSKVYPESAHQRWYGEDIPYLLDLVAAGARREGALRAVLVRIEAEAIEAGQHTECLCHIDEWCPSAAVESIEVEARAALSASPADPGAEDAPDESLDVLREAENVARWEYERAMELPLEYLQKARDTYRRAVEARVHAEVAADQRDGLPDGWPDRMSMLGQLMDAVGLANDGISPPRDLWARALRMVAAEGVRAVSLGG